ncbi:MAG: hypothetical protein ACRC46_06620, partial [Thermoguttaceae bacterium]
MMLTEESQDGYVAPQSSFTGIASPLTMDAMFALDEDANTPYLGDSSPTTSDAWMLNGRRSATTVNQKPKAADEFWKLYGLETATTLPY